jgi:hypothetical protein
MSDFISVLKKINPEKLTYVFSEISIEMFKHQEWIRTFEVPILYNGQFPRILNIELSAWDIQAIEYLSICNSNDYRNPDKPYSIGQIIGLYRDYENKHSLPEWLDTEPNGAFYLLFGMTMEQFIYQNQSWIFEMYNRNYHILVASTNIARNLPISLEEIIQEKFDCSIQEFNALLLIIFWLCMQYPDPLSAPEALYRKKQSSVLSKVNIKRFIEYYSCDYTKIRKTKIGKLLFYSKPFIKTDRNHMYLASNIYLVAMMIANSMYWLIRDYYQEQGSLVFVNSFGSMFEGYLKELATEYCTANQWTVIPQGKRKGADFVFNFGIVKMIIEQKSALISLLGKQQVPDLKALEKYKCDIFEAYGQLNSTYQEMIKHASNEKPIIKIILLYENIMNLSLAEQVAGDIFEQDHLCFISTIAEFEILLRLWHDDKSMCNKVIAAMLKNQYAQPYCRDSISKIFMDMDLYRLYHFTGERDYFQNAMKDLENEF